MPILYVAALNSSTDLGISATFGGLELPQPTTNSPNIPDGTVSYADVQAMFRFYTTPETGNINVVDNGDASWAANMSNWTPVAKASIVDAFVNGSIGSGSSGAVRDAMQMLALGIFGSTSAVDFFSNSATLEGAFVSAFQQNQVNINADEGNTATFQLMNALIATQPTRFTMKSGADPLSGAKPGTYTMIEVEALSGSGVGAGVTVQIGFGGVVASVAVTGLATTPYAIGDSIRCRQSSDFSFTIPSLNSVQVAMLNGTLGDSAIPTPVPVYVGDKIRVVYTIMPALGQLTATGDPITPAVGGYSAFIDFEVGV